MRKGPRPLSSPPGDGRGKGKLGQDGAARGVGHPVTIVSDLIIFGVNANTWDSFTNVIDWCKDQEANLFGVVSASGEPVKPHVICVQETRLKEKGLSLIHI